MQTVRNWAENTAVGINMHYWSSSTPTDVLLKTAIFLEIDLLLTFSKQWMWIWSSTNSNGPTTNETKRYYKANDKENCIFYSTQKEAIYKFENFTFWQLLFICFCLQQENQLSDTFNTFTIFTNCDWQNIQIEVDFTKWSPQKNRTVKIPIPWISSKDVISSPPFKILFNIIRLHHPCGYKKKFYTPLKLKCLKIPGTEVYFLQ